jgi:hypothetical protein
VIPFVEELGSAGTVPPAQMVRPDPKLKTGVIFGATLTEKVTGGEHNPAEGVNV